MNSITLINLLVINRATNGRECGKHTCWPCKECCRSAGADYSLPPWPRSPLRCQTSGMTKVCALNAVLHISKHAWGSGGARCAQHQC